ncbi:hypothetical protein NE865_05865 [Phthorimaea operculella]|nr:hypothetical protein NE865_05865 [Phthorimaea operculella]
MSAVEIQQEYFEAMGYADWELYEKKDRHRLLQKIAIALCGPPTEEGDLTEDQPILKLQGYDARSEDIALRVFKKICEQEKYSHNGENIIVSIIRVVCVVPSKDVPFYKPEPKDYWIDLHTKKGKDVRISIFHVFCIRKCISLKPDVKSCRIYIDHDARVYKNWESYLTENNLPKCVIVVPLNGEYKGNIVDNEIPLSFDDFVMPDVMLTMSPSPALGLGAKILSIADTTNTVAGIGAIVGAISLAVVPVAGPVAVGSLVAVGAATSVYGIIRSSIHLADRGNHEQDISLLNSESRASWLNILVSTAGLSFSAAGKLVAWAASTGTNIKILVNAVQFLKYTTIASGLLGLVNGFGEMIHKYVQYNEKPTKLELFQFTSSLLFFGIGVMSNQTAQEIVEDAQARSINNIRDSLTSNAKRKMFDKMTAETRRVRGTIQGNADIIKGLKTITNKNEFFAKLSKMNKQMNANKLRISLNSDGATMINNQHKMTVTKLVELGKTGRDKLFQTIGPAKITSKNVPTRLVSSPSTAAPLLLPVKENFMNYIRPEEIVRIAFFINTLCKEEKDFMCELLSEISSDVHQAFILLCVELLSKLIPAEVDFLTAFLGSGWKMRVVYQVFDYLVSQIQDNCDDAEREVTLKRLLKEFILNGKIKVESLEKLRETILTRITENWDKNYKPNSNPRNFDGLFESRKNSSKRYELQAGKVVIIGIHEVLIRQSTIDMLQEYLESYCQNDADLFMDLCFRVLSAMSAEDVSTVNFINLDEDVIMRIATFIIDWNVVEELLEMFKNESSEMETVEVLKQGIMDWAKIVKRNHEICSECKCVRYCI